jgi:amino acid transporter
LACLANPQIPARFFSLFYPRVFALTPLAFPHPHTVSLPPPMEQLAAPPTPAYGLRQNALSPLETLAQSVSTIAPTATPAATIPLVCALAGNGTWLAYVLATFAIFLVALCVAKFAQHSSSPGSLYSYTTQTLPAPLAAIAAWSLLLAYIGTGASVTGGFYQYGNQLIHDALARDSAATGTALTLLCVGIAMWVAWRDVKISARTMLWIEATSVSVILIVVVLVLYRLHFHIDTPQLRLQNMTVSGLRLGLVLALFSFVGFESATTLGAEARNPLKTIPRAVLQSALLSGAMFTLCAYTEVFGFRSAAQDLGTNTAPFRLLSVVAGVPIFGLIIDIGALVSLFACTLACITAAARVLLLMSHHGLAPRSLCVTHHRNETPSRCVVVTGIATGLPTAILAARGFSGFDVYGWIGSLATYGFIVAYALVCLALPRYLRLHNAPIGAARILAATGCLAMILAFVGNLYPVPTGIYGKLPYIYFAYLILGMTWFFLTSRNRSESAT